MTYVVAGLIGLVSGVTSGMFGVGGGIVMVPAMLFLMGNIRDIKMAIGTSLAVIIPTALMGVYKHHGYGNVNWMAALALAPAAIGGSYLGVWLTTQMTPDHLKRGFGGFLVLVGLRLLFLK
jgi:uncharacterized membrane protein YfcA